jgi:hypothetical protein
LGGANRCHLCCWTPAAGSDGSSPHDARRRWRDVRARRGHWRGRPWADDLTRDGERWTGTGEGEPWREDLEHGTQVKGATLTDLAVRQTDAGFEARCVVDV